jgi:hypothetical protein
LQFRIKKKYVKSKQTGKALLLKRGNSMKYATLALTLLLSSQMLAVSFEEAQRELASHSQRVEAAEKKVSDLSERVTNGHEATQSIAGKHEYADDMTKRTVGVRGNVEAHNRAVAEHAREIDELKKCVAKHGRRWNVRSTGKGYELVKQEQKALEPIVSQSAEAAQAARPVRTVRRSRVVSSSYYN